MKLAIFCSGIFSHDDFDGVVLETTLRQVSTEPDIGETTIAELVDNTISLTNYIAEVDGVMAAFVVVLYFL